MPQRVSPTPSRRSFTVEPDTQQTTIATQIPLSYPFRRSYSPYERILHLLGPLEVDYEEGPSKHPHGSCETIILAEGVILELQHKMYGHLDHPCE